MNEETSETVRLIHDIRNPLNTISVSAELGKLYLERGDDPEKLEQVFDGIARYCGVCVERLEDLEALLIKQND